jgi:glutamate/aspartate transport system substrate-binding protein
VPSSASRSPLVPSPDHAQSFALLESGRADTFATDDVLLYGLVAANRKQRDYHVVGEFLSYDPYGIMYRKSDPQMQRLVNTNFPRPRRGWRDRAPVQALVHASPAIRGHDRPADEPAARNLVRAMAAKARMISEPKE